MNNILIVEDNRFYAELMRKSILNKYPFSVDIVHTAAQARENLKSHSYDLLIIDLMLPDSSGEFVEEVCEHKDVIVMTCSEDELTRKKITSLKIIDYIIKNDSSDFEYLLNIIHRLNTNKTIKVLLAEDSVTVRKHIEQLLRIQHLDVISVKDGLEAINVFENPDEEIDFVITDYNMPNKDGLELLKYIRKNYKIEELPVIVSSSAGSEAVVARFLKAGANDYIIKPFSKEEFFCRINLTLNNLEMFRNIKKTALTDHLTGLYNRHYMQTRIAQMLKKSSVNSLAIVDIDLFKKINDNYGHHIGDMALKFLAVYMLKHFDFKNVVRLGGEEFLLLMPGVNPKKALLKMEALRVAVQNSKFIDDNGNEISFTFSAGIASLNDEQYSKSLHEADKYLYMAKENGRNRIEFEGSIDG